MTGRAKETRFLAGSRRDECQSASIQRQRLSSERAERYPEISARLSGVCPFFLTAITIVLSAIKDWRHVPPLPLNFPAYSSSRSAFFVSCARCSCRYISSTEPIHSGSPGYNWLAEMEWINQKRLHSLPKSDPVGKKTGTRTGRMVHAGKESLRSGREG